MWGGRHTYTVGGSYIDRLGVTKIQQLGMMVQRYDINLTFTLIFHKNLLQRKEWIMEEKNNKKNPFSCHRVRLNLPSGKDYVPSHPWVSKVSKDVNVANKVFIYVDEVSSLIWCDRECWNVTRCFASKFNYLGIQYAPRKRKGLDQIKGPWEGSTINTSDGLEGMLYHESWEKME